MFRSTCPSERRNKRKKVNWNLLYCLDEYLEPITTQGVVKDAWQRLPDPPRKDVERRILTRSSPEILERV